MNKREKVLLLMTLLGTAISISAIFIKSLGIVLFIAALLAIISFGLFFWKFPKRPTKEMNLTQIIVSSTIMLSGTVVAIKIAEVHESTALGIIIFSLFWTSGIGQILTEIKKP